MKVSNISLKRGIMFLAAVSFFMPLVVLPSSFIFPFIVPKVLLFRTLTLLMLAGFILLLCAHRKQIKFSWLHVIVGLFGVSFAISSIIGVDWYRSLWDNHERMLGLFTFVHYLFFYIILSSVVQTWKEWRLLMYSFLCAGSLVMLFALIQQINPDFLLNRGTRSASTLGNPIYVGGYGIFLFFLGIFLFLKEKQNFWKIVSMSGALLGLGGMLASGTRGSILGLIVGIVVAIILYGILYKKNKKMRLVIGVVAASLFLLGGIGYLYRATPFVQSVPGVGRLARESFIGGTVETRLMAWGIGYEAWKEKPFFGWGPNNYYYAFNKYYRPEFLEHGMNETWFDNAHNVPVNTLTTQGIVGVILYLALFFIPVVLLYSRFRQEKVSLHTLVLVTAFLAAHFVHNLFVFENPTSYLYFFFVLAFIAAKCRNIDIDKKAPAYVEVSPLLMVTIGFVTFIAIQSTNVNPAKANMNTLGVLRTFGSNPSQAIEEFEGVQTIPTPHIDDVRNDFARTAHQYAAQYAQQGNIENAIVLTQASVEAVRKNKTLHPLDIRIDLQLVQSLMLQASLTGNSSYMQQAEQIALGALKLSPKRQQILYLLSVIDESLGKNTEAVNYLQKAINDDPYIAESWIRLALLYQRIGKSEKAQQVIDNAQNQNVKFSLEEQRIIKTITDKNTSNEGSIQIDNN